jgi:alkylated DNA repair dioxygenase AlkB
MARAGPQQKLFDLPEHLKTGLVYRPDFLSEREEEILLDAIGMISMQHTRFGEYTAKRLSAGFGWGYDFDRKAFIPGEPLPAFLQPAARKIAKWLDIPRKRIAEALINEYPPGTTIGWHRDSEEFEHIVGISLGGWCRIRFRPLNAPRKIAPISVELEQRSAYIMQKEIRWNWQHSIAPTTTHRWSITFRTLPKNVHS